MCIKGVGRTARGESAASSRQHGNQPGDLLLQEVRRSVVQQDKVGEFYFSRQRQLLGNSLLGERAGQAALLEPCELSFGV